MIDSAELVLFSVLRASLWLVLSAIVVSFYLRVVNAQPQTRSIAWLFVLAQGCLYFCFVVEIPWYSILESTSSQSLSIRALPLEQTDTADFSRALPPAVSVLGSPSASPFTSWSPTFTVVLATIWLNGILWLAARQVIGYWRLLQHIKTATVPPAASETKWVSELQAIKTALALSGEIEMRVSTQLGPLVCQSSGGYLLVVPEIFWRHSSPRQRASILRHELTHIKRFDLWVVLLARLLALPQWFNPFARRALLSLDQSLEMGCDDQAHGPSETDRIDYAQTLIALVEFDQPSNRLALLAARPPLEQRIRRILHPQGTEMKFSRTIIGATLFIFALSSVVRVQLIAQPPLLVATTVTHHQPNQAEAKLKQPQPDQLVTMTHYIGDLIVPEANFWREYDGKQWIAVSKSPDKNTTTSFGLKSIINLIQSTIESDSWKIDGGRGKLEIHQQNLCLIATQTKNVHEQITDLLGKLRELYDIKITLSGYVVVFPKDAKSLAEYGLNVDRPFGQFSTHDTNAFRTFAFSEKHATLVDFLPYEVLNGQTVPFHFKKIGNRELDAFEIAVTSQPDRKSLMLGCYNISNDEQQPTALWLRQVPHLNRTTIGLAHVLNNESACFDITETLKDNPEKQRAILIVKASLRDSKSN